MFRRKKATTRILGRIQALLVVTRQQNNNHKITKHHRAFLTGIQSPSSSCDGREATEHGGLFLLESNRHLRRRRSTVCLMCDPARLAKAVATNGRLVINFALAFLLTKPCWLISNTTRTSQQNATASCVCESMSSDYLSMGTSWKLYQSFGLEVRTQYRDLWCNLSSFFKINR
jgi:hypothetical protein